MSISSGGALVVPGGALAIDGAINVVIGQAIILNAVGNLTKDTQVVFSESGSGKKGTSKTIFKNIDEGLNFAATPAKHMQNPDRFVPTQILQDAIKSTKGVPDPRGSNALMYYTTMTKNGKLYNLEVLYDKATNTIYHFEYTRKAIGNLPAITK